MPKTAKNSDDKYIVQSLLDGLLVIKKLMENIAPFDSYTARDIQAMFPDIDYQKMYRTLITLKRAGFVEEHEKKYSLSMDLYLLSHRYFKALEKEHGKIKDKINQFSL